MLTKVLAVSTVCFAVLVTYQYRTIAELQTTMATLEANTASTTRAAVIDQIGSQAPDVQRMLSWLNDFYKSPEGLQRPAGLCPDGVPDSVGIGAWVFDVYLRHRLMGDTDDQSRAAIVVNIKQSAEWHAKHPS